MDPASELPIGDRVRFYRKAQGKTQAVVAGLAGISEDYLSQIERGRKHPALPLVRRLAHVLAVPVPELLGEPAPGPRESSQLAGYAVQCALTARPPAAGVPDLPALRRRVDAAWAAWQGSLHRFSETAEVLPDLITEVQGAQRDGLACGAPAGDGQDAQRIAADFYFLLRSFTRRIGRTDLSLVAADRGMLAADGAGDPVRVAAARWNLGHVLLALGQPGAAEDTALAAISELGGSGAHDRPGATAMMGALWLVAAVSAARRGNLWTARDRLRDEAAPAARMTGDANVMWTVFGPTNVRLHAVSVEAEAGETGEALRLSDAVDVSRVPSMERRTTFALEVAQCYALRRDDPGVLVHLVSAEASGPEDMRFNPQARHLVEGLLRRARPTFAPQVRDLARRIDLVC